MVEQMGRAARAAVLLLAIVAGTAHAAIPQKINYQGYLTNAASQPVSATVTMTFRLYTTPAGGSAIYTETQSVAVADGIYTVAIGAVTPLNVPFDVPYYLGVTIGTDAEMTPRQAVLSSPYALRAAAVDSTAVLPAAQISGTISTAQLADGSVAREKLGPSGCTSGQVLKFDGAAWVCAADATGAGGGTVTSVTAGAGLTGGTITSSGTVAADTAYLQRRVSTPCTAGSSIRAIAADGTVTCETDDVGTGTVSSITAGSGLTGGTITGSGTIAVDPASSTLTGYFLRRGGNAFGAVATLGTIDNNAVEVVVNGSRVMRYEPNAVSPNLIGGHPNNSAGAGSGQTVAGGGQAGTSCYDPSIGTFTRSCGNQAAGSYSTIGGGMANRASGSYATVGGGDYNTASYYSATVGGGYGNTASSDSATVGGGFRNTASYDSATVGGGYGNTASNFDATVGGGRGNTASGNYATVGGGGSNTAQGSYSFAAGRRAKALADGVVLFSDSTDADFTGNVANVFAVGFTGGIGMWTSKTFATGCSIPAGGGAWTCTSSRDQKQDFAAVDAQDVLQRVAALPITEWRYRTEASGARHMGPTAQDFHAAFGLGDSDQSIGLIDANGVALAAIQGLNAKLDEREATLRAVVTAKDAEIAALRMESDALGREVADLRAANQKEIADLRLAVEVLMARTSAEGRVAQTR